MNGVPAYLLLPRITSPPLPPSPFSCIFISDVPRCPTYTPMTIVYRPVSHPQPCLQSPILSRISACLCCRPPEYPFSSSVSFSSNGSDKTFNTVRFVSMCTASLLCPSVAPIFYHSPKPDRFPHALICNPSENCATTVMHPIGSTLYFSTPSPPPPPPLLPISLTHSITSLPPLSRARSFYLSLYPQILAPPHMLVS